VAGRKPQPTHLKLVKGITRKDRVNRNEPKALPGMPDRPLRLSDAVARAAWARFGKMLLDMGVLTLADGMALERLCECYAQVNKLQRNVDNHGHTAETQAFDKNHKPIPGVTVIKARPEVAMLSDADRRLRAYLTDFGLTPSARGKISTTKPGQGADDWSA
jgi:P27 family predicted phage terminase small subunit